jgi:protein ImuA
MAVSKADIIAKLQRELLPLQGYKIIKSTAEFSELGPINSAFPNNVFPVGAVHEFISSNTEDTTATAGFISALMSKLIHKNGVAIWISSSRCIFPPGLLAFGLEPDRIIFIDLHSERDCLWAMEEALKSNALSAVVCETRDFDFTTSRRFQLAVEKTGVTGFMLRKNYRKLTTTACVSRWKVSSLTSSFENGMPGVGFPRWNVELLKVRNGKPCAWELEWFDGQFNPIYKPQIYEELIKQTG